ncbi:hypothetical protein DIC82_05675 [Clostridium beijerinckii]|nr:hypothetical protein DIC82_05675 [Clostridium beijerinckii]
MDKLKECAIAFQNLLDKQYKIILARRGKETEFVLTFDKTDFYHLIGLQKLKDLAYLKKDRAKIFDEIMEDNITYEMISKSPFFEANEEKKQFGIKKRIYYFINIEKILDSNNLAFKFNKSKNAWSLIDSEYIFENLDYDKEIYVFIDSRSQNGDKFCRSFFPREEISYTKNQTKMTLIYKEKINLTLSESIVQLDNRKRV